jgi:hypothetical protein
MDALQERFSIPRSLVKEGPVVIRAADALANIATMEVTVPAGKERPR